MAQEWHRKNYNWLFISPAFSNTKNMKSFVKMLVGKFIKFKPI